jgi:TRAP-type transport system periplasmic protein
MIRKIVFTMLIISLVALIVLTGCTTPGSTTTTTATTATTTATTTTKSFEWKLISAWGKTNYNVAQHALPWIDRVNKEMEGKLKITWAGGSESVAATKQLDPLKTGVFDVCYTAPSYFTGVIPAAGGPEVPIASVSKLKEAGIQQLIDEMFQAKAKVKSLSLVKTGSPFYLFLNQKRDTADLSGLKIRSFFIYDAMIKALNGTPVNIAPPEIYVSAQTGTIDGYFNPMWDEKYGNLAEVTKYWVEPGVGETGNVILVNLDSWNALDKATQEQLVKITEASVDNTRTNVIAEMKLIRDDLLAKGKMQVITLSPSDADRFTKLWFDQTTTSLVVNTDPEYGPRLMAMLNSIK